VGVWSWPYLVLWGRDRSSSSYMWRGCQPSLVVTSIKFTLYIYWRTYLHVPFIYLLTYLFTRAVYISTDVLIYTCRLYIYWHTYLHVPFIYLLTYLFTRAIYISTDVLIYTCRLYIYWSTYLHSDKATLLLGWSHCYAYSTVIITIWLTVTKYVKWQWIFYFLRRCLFSSITTKTTFTELDCIYEQHGEYLIRSINWLPFATTWVIPRFFWRGLCCSSL
jgi:hypothetical protein